MCHAFYAPDLHGPAVPCPVPCKADDSTLSMLYIRKGARDALTPNVVGFGAARVAGPPLLRRGLGARSAVGC